MYNRFYDYMHIFKHIFFIRADIYVCIMLSKYSPYSLRIYTHTCTPPTHTHTNIQFGAENLSFRSTSKNLTKPQNFFGRELFSTSLYILFFRNVDVYNIFQFNVYTHICRYRYNYIYLCVRYELQLYILVGN